MHTTQTTVLIYTCTEVVYNSVVCMDSRVVRPRCDHEWLRLEELQTRHRAIVSISEDCGQPPLVQAPCGYCADTIWTGEEEHVL